MPFSSEGDFSENFSGSMKPRLFLNGHFRVHLNLSLFAIFKHLLPIRLLLKFAALEKLPFG